MSKIENEIEDLAEEAAAVLKGKPNGSGKDRDEQIPDFNIGALIKSAEAAVEKNPVGGALAAFGVGFVLAKLLTVGGKHHG